MTDDVRRLLQGPVLEVAPRLLGARICTHLDGAATEIMLSEVEAYVGEQDPASHAYRGETPRNRSMFAATGTLYVYRSYGLHWCMNIVVGPEGVPHAVLLRGGVPTKGEETMRARRGRSDHLTDGPGKLCQALGVTGAHDGTDVVSGPVRLATGELPAQMRVMATPRIGITKAAEHPWRWVASRP